MSSDNTNQIITVNDITHKGKRIKFKEALTLRKYLNKDIIYVNIPKLNHQTWVGSDDTLLSDIADEFLMWWEEYVLCPDEQLSKGAREFKKEISDLIVVEDIDEL